MEKRLRNYLKLMQQQSQLTLSEEAKSLLYSRKRSTEAIQLL